MTEKEYRNIRISLRLTGTDIVARDVTGAFDDLEAGLYQADRDLVENVSRVIALDPILKDAALERVRNFRGQRVKLEHVREGSFVFDFLVAGVGIWVLKETVGESVKKGWKDSSVYLQLAHAVTVSVEQLAEHIVLLLKQSGRRIARSEIVIRVPPEVEEPTIFITQASKAEKKETTIPSLADAVAQLNKKE